MRSLSETLRRNCEGQAESRAFAFLDSGANIVTEMSRAEVEWSARAHAQVLTESGLAGATAVMLYSAEPAFVTALVGCMYSGVVGVPVQVPGRQRGIQRLREICRDADTTTVLTTSATREDLCTRFAGAPELEGLRWVETDAIPISEAARWEHRDVDLDTLALLQYTSGSTGHPRGVMISHRNLVNQAAELDALWPCEPDGVLVSWLPTFHDMGLMFGIVLPLWSGRPSYLSAPEAFIRRPESWLEAISRFRGTHTAAPNFAYDLCVRRTTAETTQTLNLSSWRVAVNGAEPVRWETLERFAERFANCGLAPGALCPGYGLAENTLKVSGSRSDRPPKVEWFSATALRANRVEASGACEPAAVPVVSCGVIAPATQVRIVDPATRLPSLPGELGEIWVSGPCVGQGYWRRPLVTSETFRARLAGGEDATTYLRTGDLGFLRHGELFVTGRLKDLLVIHGNNYHPEDIEYTVEKFLTGARLSRAAAFAIDGADGEELVLAVEVDGKTLKEIGSGRLVQMMTDAVHDEHQIPVADLVLVRRGSLQKTTSGKVRRQATRAAYLTRDLAVVEPRRRPEAVTAAMRLAGRAAAGSATASTGRDDEQTIEILDWLRGWAGRRVDSRLMDERRCMPPHLVLDLGRRGVLGMQIPSQFGGLELATRATLRVIEQLAAIDLTLATFVCVNNGLGVRPIMRHASPSLRSSLLPDLAAGRVLAAFAMTEPGAGSAVRMITSAAAECGPQRWQITGTKIWSGSAAWAQVINTFVRLTDGSGHPLGITGFSVPTDAPGLRIAEEALTLGMRGMVQSTVHFDRVQVTADQLIGAVGEGMAAARDTMMYARLMIAAMSLGAMKRVLQLQLRYAQRRTVATGRLLDNPVVWMRLSAATVAVTAVEALIYGTAELLDSGHDVPEDLFVACKVLGPELLWQVIDSAVQTLGGRGYIETNVLPQIMRDARVLRIFEGPTEVMLAHLGSSVSRPDRSGVIQLLQEHCESADLVAELTALAARRPAWSGPIVRPADHVHMTNHLLGKAAANAVLVGMLRRARGGTEAWQHALIWAHDRLQAACRDARDERPRYVDPADPDILADRICGYEDAIGAIDQDPAGVDERLDTLLRANPGAHGTNGDGPGEPPPAARPAATPPPLAEQPSGDNESTHIDHQLRAWLVEWVARYAEIPVGEVDPAQPFLRYGLDSTAVMILGGELESFVGASLRPETLWEFPTIDGLTRELAGRPGASSEADHS